MVKVKNNSNAILLKYFTPTIRFHGKTNILLNEKQYPKKKDIFQILCVEMDQGYRYCCKVFEIPGLIPELTQYALEYLYDDNVSYIYSTLFWNSIYMDLLDSLSNDIRKHTTLYESLFGANIYLEIRLYCIEKKMKYYEQLSYHASSMSSQQSGMEICCEAGGGGGGNV
jgi:hypothetical protein